MVRSVLCLLTVALAFVPLLSARKEKPGVCPKPRAPIDPIDRCMDWCFSDGECRGNLKCCFDGCRRVCLKPKAVNNMVRSVLCLLTVALAFVPLLSAVEEKPGACPKPRTDIDPTVVRCLSECSSDSECEGNLKCCFNGCGHVCEEPRVGPNTKPGSCPDPIPYFKKCEEACTDDSQCEKNLKCCNTSCGLQCWTPEYGNSQNKQE
ncbi:WAP four-disulfide core domain protein 2-like [Periophthalmus magnuspinnatus]|uniref:WAP four-disulfide core domain protein 2-like n=1 Tax=Periophthalmus magnuspinnatus TaxID=409849 RepID=UPI0024373A81|nr:WAP four-disulfide core domain protein 2-like [Periophthalmus magnuspinnatus]